MRTDHCVPALCRAPILVVLLQQVLPLSHQLSVPAQAGHTRAPLLGAGRIGAGVDLALRPQQTVGRAGVCG